MSIKDEILKSAGANPEEIKIMNALKKCFYAEHKPDEESKMVKMIQLKNGESRERYGLHGSAILKDDLCYRAQVLSLFFKQNPEDDLPLKLKAIFEEGNAVHEKWQRLFIRGGLGTADDMDVTRFAQGIELAYTPDAIIKINNIQYVVEIKSMNTYNYQKSNIHPTGALQCLFYMYYCNIHNGFVLMEDKNTQDFKIQIIEYDENKIKSYIDRLHEVQRLKAEFIRTKKPPKRICENADCENAEKCIMRDCCFGNKRELIYNKIDTLKENYELPVELEYYKDFTDKKKAIKEVAEKLKSKHENGRSVGPAHRPKYDCIYESLEGIKISYKIMNDSECEVKHFYYTWKEVAEILLK